MRARFVTDTATVNVNPVQITGRIGVKSNSVTGKVDVKTVLPTMDHDKLNNRALPDQHPIDAITNLREILNKMWTFTYEQGEPSENWVIQHNLGRNPSVIIVDSAGSVQIPDQITYDNENKITIQFIGAFAGKAFLN